MPQQDSGMVIPPPDDDMISEDAIDTEGTVAESVDSDAEHSLALRGAEHLYQIALVIHIALIPFFTQPIAEIEIDGIMPDEKVSVRIPEGCQNDQVVRVRGKGMPKFRSDLRGDLYVHASVIIPKKLSKSQRELLERLASELGEDYANPRSPLEKLRDAFN